MKRLHVLLMTLALMVPFMAQAQKSKAKADTVKVLFIGNSFTYYNDMPSMVDSIARTQKRPMKIVSITKGGERLRGHLKNEKLLKLLKRGGWDFVVVQEQSSDPAMHSSLVARDVYPAAHKIDSFIHVGSPQAKTIFYMTWGHKYGLRKPSPDYWLANTYEGMQQRLVSSYLEMAYDNNALCAPVGLAWREVRHGRPYMALYRPDCYHPSVAGSYLAANVIYTTMFPKRYQTAYLAGLDPTDAEYLQQMAQNAVFDNEDILPKRK